MAINFGFDSKYNSLYTGKICRHDCKNNLSASIFFENKRSHKLAICWWWHASRTSQSLSCLVNSLRVKCGINQAEMAISSEKDVNEVRSVNTHVDIFIWFIKAICHPDRNLTKLFGKQLTTIRLAYQESFGDPTCPLCLNLTTFSFVRKQTFRCLLDEKFFISLMDSRLTLRLPVTIHHSTDAFGLPFDVYVAASFTVVKEIINKDESWQKNRMTLTFRMIYSEVYCHSTRHICRWTP